MNPVRLNERNGMKLDITREILSDITRVNPTTLLIGGN